MVYYILFIYLFNDIYICAGRVQSVWFALMACALGVIYIMSFVSFRFL
jgi:hypothetical protein